MMSMWSGESQGNVKSQKFPDKSFCTQNLIYSYYFLLLQAMLSNNTDNNVLMLIIVCFNNSMGVGFNNIMGAWGFQEDIGKDSKLLKIAQDCY